MCHPVIKDPLLSLLQAAVCSLGENIDVPIYSDCDSRKIRSLQICVIGSLSQESCKPQANSVSSVREKTEQPPGKGMVFEEFECLFSVTKRLEPHSGLVQCIACPQIQDRKEQSGATSYFDLAKQKHSIHFLRSLRWYFSSLDCYNSQINTFLFSNFILNSTWYFQPYSNYDYYHQESSKEKYLASVHNEFWQGCLWASQGLLSPLKEMISMIGTMQFLMRDTIKIRKLFWKLLKLISTAYKR